MNRYIIKLINAITGMPMFIASANRRSTPKGKSQCAHCFTSFDVVRRTDRFCSPACQKQFAKDVREWEKRYGKLVPPMDERIVPTHKPVQKTCLNKECKKRFFTKAKNHFFCSVACRTRYGLLFKHQDNKKWLRRDRIRKNGK